MSDILNSQRDSGTDYSQSIPIMKRRWRSGKRAGLQNLYSRVQFPLGAPESPFTTTTPTTNF
jgi:hypothetical protein